MKLINDYSINSKNEDQMDEGSVDYVPSHVALPASIDWRDKGAVTRVKDQGSFCGSCWSFATTGAIEGQYFLKTGHLLSLSEQNLVDCSQPFGNFGCNGGYINRAFLYIIQSGGIKTEETYPYRGVEGSCRSPFYSAGAQIHDYVTIRRSNETKLQEAIATIGPIPVYIDASLPSLHHYSRGIYYDHHCDSSNMNHAVLVVGYGTDEHERDYYIVKNSWGTSWGDGGYFRIARNHHNHCGIANYAYYPLI